MANQTISTVSCKFITYYLPVSLRTKLVEKLTRAKVEFRPQYGLGTDITHLRTIFVKAIDKKKLDSIRTQMNKEFKAVKAQIPVNHKCLTIFGE